tara:strand:- start:69 stop:602 length:534 start_codon:yes stop_codon:yes gene_type:complete
MPPINIFETPLWIFEREVPEGMRQWALDFKREVPIGRRRSNRGGYQSDAYNGLENLPLEYENSIRDTLKEMPEFIFGCWWLNLNYKGNHNIAHTHPNSDLALVWNITDNHGLLNFRHPAAHERWRLLNVMGMVEEYNMNAKAGTVIVFPADLIHYVLPHELETPRITISMNLGIVMH